MRHDTGDLRSFLHGVINLIWPVFAYDLAELASLIIWGYSWASMVPSTIMLILPIVSDVVGDDLDVIASGPTVPDTSTFADCLRVVEHYGLRWKMPQSIWARIEAGLQGRIPETPKADEPAFGRVRNVLVASVKQALEAAADEAVRCGFVPRILTTEMSGEARLTAARQSVFAKFHFLIII